MDARAAILAFAMAGVVLCSIPVSPGRADPTSAPATQAETESPVRNGQRPGQSDSDVEDEDKGPDDADTTDDGEKAGHFSFEIENATGGAIHAVSVDLIHGQGKVESGPATGEEIADGDIVVVRVYRAPRTSAVFSALLETRDPGNLAPPFQYYIPFFKVAGDAQKYIACDMYSAQCSPGKATVGGRVRLEPGFNISVGNYPGD